MKIETLEQFHRAGGIASAKKRLAGMTKEEISERMREIRKGKRSKSQAEEIEIEN